MRMNNMYEYREGAKSASLCTTCQKKVPVTLTSETLSFCDGMEEVKDVLVYICDICGNMCSIPYESLSAFQIATAKLLESNVVSKAEEVTVELKSSVDREKLLENESKPDYQHEYPMRATG